MSELPWQAAEEEIKAKECAHADVTMLGKFTRPTRRFCTMGGPSDTPLPRCDDV